MPRLQADLDTLQRVRVVLADAMERGLDAAEALDRAGLIHHEALAARIVSDAIQRAAEVVDGTSMDQVARELSERQASSPLEAKRQIVALLKRVTAP